MRGQWQSHVKSVQAPLLKNILQSGERIVRVSQEGKPSETRFKVEERYAFATLVRCSPVTGRTIRSVCIHSMRVIRLPLTIATVTVNLTDSSLKQARD